METSAKRYPLIDSTTYLCKTGQPFTEPVDDDEPTTHESMDDDEEEDIVDEGNDLMVFDRSDDKA